MVDIFRVQVLHQERWQPTCPCLCPNSCPYSPSPCPACSCLFYKYFYLPNDYFRPYSNCFYLCRHHFSAHTVTDSNHTVTASAHKTTTSAYAMTASAYTTSASIITASVHIQSWQITLHLLTLRIANPASVGIVTASTYVSSCCIYSCRALLYHIIIPSTVTPSCIPCTVLHHIRSVNENKWFIQIL